MQTFIDPEGIGKILEHAITCNLPALLIGETGTGKTTCIRSLAEKHEKELIRVSVNGNTGVEELLGKWLLKDGETVWINGVITNAMERGHYLVMDEINAALPEVLFLLHSLLDDDRKVLLAEKNGEIVRPHEDFRFFATMNPCATYAGTKSMNTALLSRFGVVIQIKSLTPAKEAKLIESTGCTEEQATRLVQCGTLLRKAWREESIALFCSTRDLMHAGRLLQKGETMETAVEYAIVNKGESEEDRKEVCKILKEIIEVKIESLRFFTSEDVMSLIARYAKQLAETEQRLSEYMAENNKLMTERDHYQAMYEILMDLLKSLFPPVQSFSDELQKKIDETKSEKKA